MKTFTIQFDYDGQTYTYIINTMQKTTILHMPLLHTILLKQLLKRNVVKKKE